MEASARYALKEWAVVCAALERGRQTLLLRKGGIAEGPTGFEVRHRGFWLFPTRFHQTSGELNPDAGALLADVESRRPPAGVVRLSACAEVSAVRQIVDEDDLRRLDGLHILSPATIRERFFYREPGLFALTLRVYRRAEPLDVPDLPHYAGCRSWVDLAENLPTEGLAPVLTDDEFATLAERIRQALD
jgi:hypothetical protein